MPFAIALIGTKECSYGLTTEKGEADNILILKMLAASNNTPNGKDSSSDLNAWCAATVNWCLAQAGITGTGSPNAGSFIGWNATRYTCLWSYWGSG